VTVQQQSKKKSILARHTEFATHNEEARAPTVMSSGREEKHFSTHNLFYTEWL
jgi:hypothetical protein